MSAALLCNVEYGVMPSQPCEALMDEQPALGTILSHVALLLFAGLIGEAGIVVDLLITVSMLIWMGGQGNAWLRRSALNRGFKLVSSSPPTPL
jgi:hypothetical protein